MHKEQRRHVAVIGPAQATPTELAAAAEVGRRLAEAGAVVLTGGAGGVMDAAGRAARAAGAEVVALLPGADRSACEPDTAGVVIPTGLGELRNALLVRAADAVVCVGGSWGTLSEVALARRTGVPVVVLNGWQVRDRDGTPVPGTAEAATPEAAVQQALAAASARSAGHP